MILRRLTRHIRDQNWVAVGLDFFIVVVGVFIGIQVANWNDTRREEELARTHLESLRQDFMISLGELEDRRARLVNIIGSMVTLLEVDPDDTPSAEELNELFERVQMMPTFYWASRTYDNLIGSGELRLIDDPAIAERLAQFDTQARINTLVQQNHEQQLVETFQPWIIEHMDYVAVHLDRLDGELALPAPREPERILALIEDRQFRNLLVQKWMICGDLLHQNRLLREQAQALADRIDTALGHPTD